MLAHRASAKAYRIPTFMKSTLQTRSRMRPNQGRPRRPAISIRPSTAPGLPISAQMVVVAVLMMNVPIVLDHLSLMEQSIATPALKASSGTNASDLINDAISTLVIVPDAETQQASALPPIKAPQLEARIRDALKGRAFPDIGVSVSTKGDAYLAGEVYSLDEARKISHILHNANRGNRGHFLHPDVHPAGCPAVFWVS